MLALSAMSCLELKAGKYAVSGGDDNRTYYVKTSKGQFVGISNNDTNDTVTRDPETGIMSISTNGNQSGEKQYRDLINSRSGTFTTENITPGSHWGNDQTSAYNVNPNSGSIDINGSNSIRTYAGSGSVQKMGTGSAEVTGVEAETESNEVVPEHTPIF